MDYPISTVGDALNLSGRTVTRHWIQQNKKHGFIVPSITGKGRHGDRYTVQNICQVALFYDLSKSGFTNAEAAKLAFDRRTEELFGRALTKNVLSPKHHAGPISIVFARMLDRGVRAFEVLSIGDHVDLFETLHFKSDITRILSLKNVVIQIESALEALGR